MVGFAPWCTHVRLVKIRVVVEGTAKLGARMAPRSEEPVARDVFERAARRDRDLAGC